MTGLNGRGLAPVPKLARQADLTPTGLLKILKRIGKAVRDDGHWYADPADVSQITQARRVLGLSRAKVQAGTSGEQHLA
jgi:hypothetical protein